MSINPTPIFFGGLSLGLLVALLVARRQAMQRAAMEQELGSSRCEVAAAQGQLVRLHELGGMLRHKEAVIDHLRAELAEAQAARRELGAALEAERRGAGEKIALLDHATAKLRDTFQALSADALRGNQATFLQAAEATLRPLRESLDKVDGRIHELECHRQGAYAALCEQVRSLAGLQAELQKETGSLARALRSPGVRGRWGEIQLRRVVELAGMAAHCDFTEQADVAPTDSGDGHIRPDLIVHLPGDKCVIVDAKAPLHAYLAAHDAVDDPARRAGLRDHARHVRQHIALLAGKDYWSRFPATPEFVVLFLPGEAFFSAALEEEPTLIEHGIRHKVILATPTTLVALLRTVAYGWQKERLAESAERVSEVGRELFDRVRVLAGHFAALRRGLGSAVESYNRAAASLDSRVLVAARRLRDLGAGDGEIPRVDALTDAPRVAGEQRTA